MPRTRVRSSHCRPGPAEARGTIPEGVQQDLGTGPLYLIGWKQNSAKDHSRCIHQEKTLPSLGPLAGIVAHGAALRCGAHRLAVQCGCGRSAALPFRLARRGSNPRVQSTENRPPTPLSEDVIDRLSRREVLGKKPPRAAALDQEEDGVDHRPERSSGAPQSARCRR